jgi:ABC-type lipoprotein export system ATPase subunit
VGDVADRNAGEISGGQKQRVAIARALMNRPQLVLADEPTANLDTENTELVYDLFRKINREWGTAFLIVTHDQGIAHLTGRILEVCDAKLLRDAAYVGEVPASTLSDESARSRRATWATIGKPEAPTRQAVM